MTPGTPQDGQCEDDEDFTPEQAARAAAMARGGGVMRRRSPRPKPELLHLWTVCPDCGTVGAHHSYTDRAGELVGVRCG